MAEYTNLHFKEPRSNRLNFESKCLQLAKFIIFLIRKFIFCGWSSMHSLKPYETSKEKRSENLKGGCYF